eukprot:gene7563-5383_t
MAGARLRASPRRVPAATSLGAAALVPATLEPQAPAAERAEARAACAAAAAVGDQPPA